MYVRARVCVHAPDVLYRVGDVECPVCFVDPCRFVIGYCQVRLGTGAEKRCRPEIVGLVTLQELVIAIQANVDPNLLTGRAGEWSEA